MRRVVVGMSGGVDSSVAAALLMGQGYEVIGVTMDLLGQSEQGENKAVIDAKAVADKLAIKHYVLDLKDVFREHVLDYFIDEYLLGRTPNPCIACNKNIKFGALLNKAMDLGADFIATGHYARNVFGDGRYKLLKSWSEKKDQTYFLYTLSQDKLKHILFPLGEFASKDEIRAKAAELGLFVAQKKDSQDICFIDKAGYVDFINKEREIKMKKGSFIDEAGNCIGEHEGILNYTIGQRKGLGRAFGKPVYVIAIDAAKNTVTLGSDGFGTKLICNSSTFISGQFPDKKDGLTAKIRYAATPAQCEIEDMGEGKIKVLFKDPQRAITPGQSIVFYSDDEVLGGGIIEGV